MTADRERVHAETRAEWRTWLSAHAGDSPGAWLVSWKKVTGRPAVSYDDAVREALCFGWVDSVPRKLDDERTMLYFSPRKPRSGWSRPNKERISELDAAGLLAPGGHAAVERAQRDGSWTMLDDVENLTVPDDLALALGERPPAREHWDAFPPSVRRGLLEWITQARRPETRERRVLETADRARDNERANQWRGPAR